MYKYLVPLLILTTANLNAKEVTKEIQMGFSLITPGGLNFVAKGYIGNNPVQISLGSLGSGLYGIEAGYSFYYDKARIFRSAQFITGTIHAKDSFNLNKANWTYGGVSATFQWRGFYLEPGLTIGKGDFSNPQASFQIGYLW